MFGKSKIVNYRINQDVVEQWFETDRQWELFLEDVTSKNAFGGCRRCFRIFKNMPNFSNSVDQNRKFLDHWKWICSEKCKKYIFDSKHNKRRQMNLCMRDKTRNSNNIKIRILHKVQLGKTHFSSRVTLVTQIPIF